MGLQALTIVHLVGRHIFSVEQLGPVKSISVVHDFLAQRSLGVEIQMLEDAVFNAAALVDGLMIRPTMAATFYVIWLRNGFSAGAAVLGIPNGGVLVTRARAKPCPDIPVVLLVAEGARVRRCATLVASDDEGLLHQMRLQPFTGLVVAVSGGSGHFVQG